MRPTSWRGSALSAAFSLTDWAGIDSPGLIWAALRSDAAAEWAALATLVRTEVIFQVLDFEDDESGKEGKC